MNITVKRELSKEQLPSPNWPVRMSMGYPVVMNNVGGRNSCEQCFLWAGGPSLYRKAGLASHGEQGMRIN